MKKVLCYINLLLFLLLVPFSVGSQVLLSEVLIDYQGPQDFRDQVISMVSFKTGDRVEQKQVQNEIEHLRRTGAFSEVSAEWEPTGKEAYRLKINLFKFRKVRNIFVSGNYPVLGKNIRKIIPSQSGTNYDETLIPEAIEAVKRYMEKNGFYDSKVKIKVRESKEFDVIDLDVKIKRGRTYHVDQITIKGNHFLKENVIKNKISRYSRFRVSRLKKNLKNIQKLYASKGYIKARVRAQEVVFHEDTGKVDLVISVRENKKFKLKILGDTYFNKQRLKSVPKLIDGRSYDRYAINRGKLRLERYYHLKGFPNVVVSYDVQKPTPDQVIVSYTIEPGPRVELKQIQFQGLKQMSEKKLKRAMESQETGFMEPQFFHEDILQKDSLRIAEAYEQAGFFDVEVSEPVFEDNRFGDKKKAVYDVIEGVEYRMRQIKVLSDLPLDTPYLLKISDLKEGKKFQAEKVQMAGELILNAVFEQGYAYAVQEVALEPDRDNKTVDVIFNISRGEKVFVRSIIIDGNLMTQESVIRKNLKIKTGQFFSYQKMLDGQLNLRRLGVFSSVRISPLGYDEKEDQIDLFVNLIERKTVAVNLQVGFDSRNMITGEFNFTKRNLYGTARQLNWRFIGGQEYDRAEMTFYSPRVFGASWNLSVQGFGQYEDQPYFDAVSYGAFASTLKNFGPHWTFGFKEQISQTDVFESKSNVATLGDSLFDNTFNEFQMSLLLDLRDNFSDPQRGVYVLAQNELNTDLSKVSNNFNTARFNMNHYFGFLKRFTLVNTFRYGHTFALSNSPRIPVNKLFFLGGSDTMRGFSEDGIDPSGGTVLFIYNTELQYRFSESMKLAGFFDAGVIGDDINALTIDDVRQSAGVGLRYFTPIGPIRLDWGFILDRQGNEPSHRVHFSFGYFF